MVSFKNFILYGASVLAITTAAAPTGEGRAELQPEVDEVSPNYHLMGKRKNTNKCEAHIHIDTSNAACGMTCTEKFAIDILDNSTPAKAIGMDYAWKNVGTWYATDDKDTDMYKIKTTRGLEFHIRGSVSEAPLDIDHWRESFTLKYGSQTWNSAECENWKRKDARISNGFRNEWDLWCEFDC